MVSFPLSKNPERYKYGNHFTDKRIEAQRVSHWPKGTQSVSGRAGSESCKVPKQGPPCTHCPCSGPIGSGSVPSFLVSRMWKQAPDRMVSPAVPTPGRASGLITKGNTPTGKGGGEKGWVFCYCFLWGFFDHLPNPAKVTLLPSHFNQVETFVYQGRKKSVCSTTRS